MTFTAIIIHDLRGAMAQHEEVNTGHMLLNSVLNEAFREPTLALCRGGYRISFKGAPFTVMRLKIKLKKNCAHFLWQKSSTSDSVYD